MKVIKLYLENNGIRSISRLTGTLPSMVLKWIKKTSETIKNQIEEKLKKENNLIDFVILEIDEYAPMHIKNLKIQGEFMIFWRHVARGRNQIVDFEVGVRGQDTYKKSGSDSKRMIFHKAR